MKKTRKTKQGFTIIEVVLVLALAGLIFMMVFIALPQLQRSQRDATRKDDMMLFVEAVKKYQTNNRGALPTKTGYFGTETSTEEKEANTWKGFRAKYLDADFGDPRDGIYNLKVEECKDTKEYKCGEAQDYSYDTTIHVFTQGVCEEDHAVQTANPRDFAVVYRTESSGVYCFDSSS